MAAVDYFLKIDGIKGESEDDKNKGQIDLESWSWGATQSGGHSYGGGGGAGKVQMQDFHFVMKINEASPKLLEHCATGKHIPNAYLECRKAGGTQGAFLKVKFSDLLVSSYQTGGSGGSDIVPVDQISLNFSKIEIDYFKQDKAGVMVAAGKTGYDLKANKKIG